MVTTSSLLNRTQHGNGMLKNWQGVLKTSLILKMDVKMSNVKKKCMFIVVMHLATPS